MTSDDAKKCPACFGPLVVETVQILQGVRYTPEAKWVDSSVQRCEACKHTFGGTLQDRLAYISGVYGYKYFGDYELNDEQSDAVWGARTIAEKVPALLEALKAADEALAQFTAFEDDARHIMGNTNFAIVQQRREQVRAAIAKAEGATP